MIEAVGEDVGGDVGEYGFDDGGDNTVCKIGWS